MSVKSIRKWFGRFLGDERGVSMIVVAMALPALMAASGVAVDLAQGYNIKTRLGNALDKAALAAGTTSGDADQVEEQVRRFVEANYPENSLGVAYDIEAEVSEMSIRVTATAEVKTMFMHLFGVDTIEIRSESEVIRELSGVEVVLVLDVTGSMAGNNITALKAAAENFLNIMFGRIVNRDYIRVGIVPFSNAVNVGRAGLDGGFVSRPSSDPYISPAGNIQYANPAYPNTTNQWRGCVLERGTLARDTTDVRSPNWGMYRHPRCATYNSNGTCRTTNSDPNRGCPWDRVVPLTNDKDLLVNTVRGLRTDGNTYGNVGMAWGWRVISPEEPYTQGVAYDDPNWTKIVIMMTDGDNTMHPTYSAYGETRSHNIDADDLDDRFEDICENMKAEGLTLYTITFQSGISNATREIFRRCATEPAMYYNAPSNSDLHAAFTRIANQLSQLHLSK